VALTLTADSIEWVTLDEVKAHLNVTSATSNEELILVQQAAQGAVEGIIGPVLWRAVTEDVTSSWRGVAVLSMAPVVSVTSLTSSGYAATYTLNTTIGTLTGVSHTGALVATYVAGRATVSDDIRYATLIIAAHLWETQRGNAPTPGFNEEAFGGTPGVGYAIPNRAQDLLAPHRLAAGIA
jgi:hypothetical protein